MVAKYRDKVILAQITSLSVVTRTVFFPDYVYHHGSKGKYPLVKITINSKKHLES